LGIQGEKVKCEPSGTEEGGLSRGLPNGGKTERGEKTKKEIMGRRDIPHLGETDGLSTHTVKDKV